MHRLPTKEIIINDNAQITVLEDDGTGYVTGDIVANTSGGFILSGFLTEIIWASSVAAATAANPREGQLSYLNTLPDGGRMTATSSSAGTAEILGYTVTAAAGAKAGDTYRLVVDSLDLTPTEYQNRPIEKRYQLSVDCANPTAIVAELVAQINADPKSPVTAYAGQVADVGKIVMVAKTVGTKMSFHVGSYNVNEQTTYSVSLAKIVATLVDIAAGDLTTTDGALPVGTYDALKNINFAKNFHIDRDINYMPLPGAAYKSYYFEVVSTLKDNANADAVNMQQNNRVYGVRLYVKSGLTTILTALDAVDANVG
jgi:hypothetical protein